MNGKSILTAFVLTSMLLPIMAVAVPIASAQQPGEGWIPDIETPDNWDEYTEISGAYSENLSGKVQITADTNVAGDVSIDADVRGTGDLTVSGSVSGSVQITGDVSVSVDVGAGGSVKASGNVTAGGSVSGTVEAGESVTVSGTISGSVTAGGSVTVGGSVEAGGSVTLTTPGVTLDVSGGIAGDVTVTEDATVNVGYVKPENPMTVSVEASALTGVSISVHNEVANVSIDIVKLAEKPVEIEPTPPGVVCNYIRIDTENVIEADISIATIEFKVEKSWLVEVEISADDVILSRYHDGNWVPLTVEQIGEDTTYVYYRTTTPGFSTFAISGEKSELPLMLIAVAVVAIVIVCGLIAVTRKRGG